MMKARSYDRRILTRGVKPNVYSIKESKFLADSWQKISDDEKFREIFQTVVDTFIDAKEYGSILNVPDADYDYVLSVIDDFQQSVPVDFEVQILRGKTDDIRALVNQAKLMAKKYTAVVTNPPYMNKFDAKLKKYIADNFAEYKGDLFSVFMYHNFYFCTPDGYSAFMTPNVWMFIKSYEALRKYIINYKGISSLIQMAKGAFFKEATVDICAFVLHNSHNNLGDFIRLEDFKGDMEIQKQKVLEALADKSCGYYYETDQTNFSKIPGSPIAYWLSLHCISLFADNPSLSSIMDVCQGMKTADNNRFLRLWHEPAFVNGEKWFSYNKGGDYRRWYGNREYVVNWENNGKAIKKYEKSVIRNERHFFDEGLTWTLISSGTFGIRYSPAGSIFDGNGSMVFPDHAILLYTLGVLSSKVATKLLSVLSPTLTFEIGQLSKLPFKLEPSEEINHTVGQNIVIAQSDWDSYETSWDFKRNPLV